MGTSVDGLQYFYTWENRKIRDTIDIVYLDISAGHSCLSFSDKKVGRDIKN